MPDRPSPRVAWIMRKPRSLGNFSIETSYRTMGDAWPRTALVRDPHREPVHLGHPDRLAIWNEVQQLDHPVLRITGDIHFAAIGLHHRPVVLTIHDLGMLEEVLHSNAFSKGGSGPPCP